MVISFDRLLGEVNRLLTFTKWHPIQRCQISFYNQVLSSYIEEFQTFTIRHEDCLTELLNDTTLNILVNDILSYVTTSVDTANISDLSLVVVGDRLAFLVAKIYKAFMQDVDFRDITSRFYFDRNKFKEQSESEFSEYSGDPLDAELKREVFVGFQAEASNLLKQLVCITKKQLQVISIVGMAGLGKTTLATRLYNNPYVVSYFYTRAWVTCSQVCHKRDILLSIISSVAAITDEICKMNDNMLSHILYRALMGRRYLIVIDDIWSTGAWDDLKMCLPDDNNGSKIMLTTRLKDVALHAVAQSNGNPLCLRFLTEEESFDLFRMKVFVTGKSYGNLSLIGRRITRKCRGLPLAIVVLAGLLKNTLKRDWWAHVEKSVRSYIITDENQYIDTLALSYNHLPRYLRPCFLSFGAFPEDHDIPVRELFRLWIAEGFISQEGTKNCLEDVAEDYLMDLISRSLVVVGKEGPNGAIRTCCIHDLLRDLCLRKAEEENFPPNIHNYNKHSYICSHSLTNPSTKSQLLLSTNVCGIPKDCPCYNLELSKSFFKNVSIVWETSKPIRALDISSIELFVFPSELLQLVQLRYLKLRFKTGNPPESISHLRELQSLIISSRMNIIVPKTMWKMLNLRHLCIKTGENLVTSSSIDEEPDLLENLQTMSLVSPTRLCQHILAKTRNLRKLGLCGPLTTKSGELNCPDLGLLMHLETLKLLNTVPLCKSGRLSNSIVFPRSLRNLTVSNTYLDWMEAWVFEMMPNLEVLKLKFHAFFGSEWKTSPEAFPRLKFLSLDEMNIVTWTASRYHFPMLQRLQVYRCPYLMEIPEDFGNICTLEFIEISGCSDTAANSARDIQKEQKISGNDWLKILFRSRLTKPMHKSKDKSVASAKITLYNGELPKLGLPVLFFQLCDGAISWVKPQKNTVKVTVNTAIFSDRGEYGFGMAARNPSGDLVQARTNVNQGLVSPELAEAMAVKEALCWIKQQNWSTVGIESDCLVVVQAIRSTVPMVSPFGLITEECPRTLRSLNKSSLSANIVTHQLARVSYLFPDRVFDRSNVRIMADLAS